MEVVSISLFLLLAVVVSGAVARMLPWSVPTPLVQIALGGVIGLSTEHRVELDPELFLFLFLPPLLFLDGWRIPKDELFKDLSTVVELALGLVLLTVVGMGFFIHWMIPAMPLAVAIALAAVVSPTDPIAVSAIAARVPIPKRMMHILEGESLLNDASGLVCLRFAIAAALTGTFSATAAAVNFLWVAGAGLAIGVVLTIVVSRAKAWVTRRFGEDSGSQILVSLLIPFGSYLLAEHFHASGILAAVGAGVTMTYVEISRQTMAATRMRRNSVWDMVQFALNGIIFVLLGEQLPAIIEGAKDTVALTGHASPWWLAVYILAIVAGLALLRFCWVWVSLRLTILRKAPPGALRSPDWRLVATTSFAGVRGAITLAGVLTLPLTLTDGSPFPARDLAIFLAAGVIIVSLLLATFALPVLLKGLTLPAEPSHQAQEDAARITTARAAVRAIERQQHALAEAHDDPDLYIAAGARVMDVYRERIDGLAGGAPDALRTQERLSAELRLIGVKAERDELSRLIRSRTIGSETARKLVRELDLAEARYRG
ncbi:Na+/H+ antiporter [Sphingomonas sp. 2R-10]|uniref:Na+/H+ antiporter n=1 Tax=Sphingomonas sp. 2R-10 TaxID=3045148 RepID=UPI0019D21CA4|nr:Na+/H+ antiporter [Sphingomonas sp. 2R-10]MDJ0277590.1 Na+/H+ antiporter [Sphingomonas sp. 2R-10]